MLEIRQLSVEFPTNHGWFRAVDGIDLTVGLGEILAIVGESGSGKSVAMMALMGLLPPNTRIHAEVMKFQDTDLLKLSAKERRKMMGRDIAMIFQEPIASLNPCFTIHYQIDEILAIHTNLSAKARTDKIVELLTSVGIASPSDRMKSYPHQLSGGMCQRVGIAMALACHPKLLIADEPTTALDVTIQAQILHLLTQLQQNFQLSLVIITHDMGVVAQTAERVAVFYAGQKVEDQKVHDLFLTPHHPYTKALLTSLPELAELGKPIPAIGGVVPGQFDRPNGCLFNPRCAFTQEICHKEKPQWHHNSLCHYPLNIGAK